MNSPTQVIDSLEHQKKNEKLLESSLARQSPGIERLILNVLDVVVAAPGIRCLGIGLTVNKIVEKTKGEMDPR